MSQGTLAGVATVCGATMPPVDVEWQGVSTDTRTLESGELYFGLNGPNFRGADFAATARERGASAAVLDRPVDDTLPHIVVDDTVIALGQVAADWRRRFEIPLIGLTGSNGKTTVKQMLAACLGANALATDGNLNNAIGVPLTLLRLTERHDRAVIEMGANRAGEIAYLTSLVKPTIGLITNAGPAHLEGFGSLDGVATSKGELFAALSAGDIAVINADDDYAPLWHEMAEPAAVRTFGIDVDADCRAVDIVESPGALAFTAVIDGIELPVELPVDGRHNVSNACAALAAATAAGIDAALATQRIAAMTTATGRLNRVRLADGTALIDDTYNANPASMSIAVRVAAGDGRPVWAVLGDMGELGADAESLHAELGRECRRAGVSRLLGIGPLMRSATAEFGAGAVHFDDHAALISALLGMQRDDVTILVKGSRSAGMERVVAALRDRIGVA